MIPAPATRVRSAVDQKALAKLEAKVDGLESSYIEVGQSLEAIRLLYERGGLSSDEFETHCYNLWGWAKVTVYEKIRAAQIAVLVRRAVPPPANLTIALALSTLDEADRIKVWKQVATEARGRITAAAVREAVADLKNTNPEGAVQVSGAKALAGLPAETVKDIITGGEQKTQAEAPARVRGETDQASVVSNILSKVASLAKLIDQWEGDRDLALKKINQLKAIFQE